jgi:hypothetical protein
MPQRLREERSGDRPLLGIEDDLDDMRPPVPGEVNDLEDVCLLFVGQWHVTQQDVDVFHVLVEESRRRGCVGIFERERRTVYREDAVGGTVRRERDGRYSEKTRRVDR